MTPPSLFGDRYSILPDEASEWGGVPFIELGTLLRREKLYSGQLTTWRRELADDGVEKLHKTTPGPAASKTVEQKRIEALERENGRLETKLSAAEDCLSLQKKALSMLDRMSNGNEA